MSEQKSIVNKYKRRKFSDAVTFNPTHSTNPFLLP